MNKFLPFFFLAFYINIKAQVAITEVYFDTPHIEYKDADPNYHHAGEFIELFNYTTEDINIGRWLLGDDENSFEFPDNTIIKSNDYLIIAYTNTAIKAKNPNYFLDFFPNSREHSNKIIYTDRIVLNNFKESISLFMKTIRGELIQGDYYGVKIDGFQWEFKNKISINGNYNTSFLNANYDYYKLSLHKINEYEYEDYRDVGSFISIANNLNDVHFKKANPFGLHFTPKLIRLEDIPYIKHALNQYEHFGIMTILPNLFNLYCNPSIPIISYNLPNETYSLKKCFNYDAAGNYTSAISCLEIKNPIINDTIIIKPPIDFPTPFPVPEFTIDEVENYENSFFVTPNPTTGNISISWDKTVENSLSKIHIIPFNASKSIEVKFNKNSNTTSYDLSTYPKGIYFIEFILENGQIITKKIIKL